MKGSSSARLPKINTGYLVTKQSANTETRKNNENQKSKTKATNPTTPRTPRKNKKLADNTGPPDIGKLSELISPRKLEPINVTKQKSDVRRHEPHTVDKYKLNGEPSTTSIEKRRLISAKSRDHLLTLMPTRGNADMIIDDELLMAARYELTRLRKHFPNISIVKSRDHSSQSGPSSLLQQANTAARINHSILGWRDRTNNCHRDIEFDFVFGARRTARPSAVGTLNQHRPCQVSILSNPLDLPKTQVSTWGGNGENDSSQGTDEISLN